MHLFQRDKLTQQQQQCTKWDNLLRQPYFLMIFFAPSTENEPTHPGSLFPPRLRLHPLAGQNIHSPLRRWPSRGREEAHQRRILRQTHGLATRGKTRWIPQSLLPRLRQTSAAGRRRKLWTINECVIIGRFPKKMRTPQEMPIPNSLCRHCFLKHMPTGRSENERLKVLRFLYGSTLRNWLAFPQLFSFSW